MYFKHYKNTIPGEKPQAREKCEFELVSAVPHPEHSQPYFDVSRLMMTNDKDKGKNKQTNKLVQVV